MNDFSSTTDAAYRQELERAARRCHELAGKTTVAGILSTAEVAPDEFPLLCGTIQTHINAVRHSAVSDVARIVEALTGHSPPYVTIAEMLKDTEILADALDGMAADRMDDDVRIALVELSGSRQPTG